MVYTRAKKYFHCLKQKSQINLADYIFLFQCWINCINFYQKLLETFSTIRNLSYFTFWWCEIFASYFSLMMSISTRYDQLMLFGENISIHVKVRAQTVNMEMQYQYILNFTRGIKCSLKETWLESRFIKQFHGMNLIRFNYIESFTFLQYLF